MTKAELQAAYDALRAEADQMRTELAVHRAHVCPMGYGPVCTCANGQLTTLRCPVHQGDSGARTWTGWINPGNVCAGAAAGNPSVIVVTNTAPAQPVRPAAAAAGGALWGLQMYQVTG